MEFPRLDTERLSLVQISKEYTNRYFEIMSKDEVTKYYGMESLKQPEQANKIIESFQQNFESKRGIRWGILLKEENEFIGTVGLNNLSPWQKRTEIGYELHPDYWGKGLTSEAVKEVMRYVFEELELFRIGAVTFPKNEASGRLLEKLGFTLEGTLRGYLFQYNQSHDALVFSFLKTDWKNEKSHNL